MISEYMLIYFLKKHIKNRQLDLWEMWKEIEPLQTKVEYITVSDEYYEIPVDDEKMILVLPQYHLIDRELIHLLLK